MPEPAAARRRCCEAESPVSVTHTRERECSLSNARALDTLTMRTRRLDIVLLMYVLAR